MELSNTDLWPNPIVTSLELIKAVLERCEIAEINGTPLAATAVLRDLIKIIEYLEINK